MCANEPLEFDFKSLVVLAIAVVLCVGGVQACSVLQTQACFKMQTAALQSPAVAERAMVLSRQCNY